MALNIVFYKKDWLKEYEKISKPDDLVFFIGPCKFDDVDKIRNNSKELNDIALEERDIFVDWIASQNKLFLENKLTYDDLSLFFLSDLSVKRNDVLETYDIYCNLKQIQKIIERDNIDQINIFNSDPKFEKSIKSIIKLKNIKIIKFKKKKIIRNIYIEFFSTTYFFIKCMMVSFFNFNKKFKDNIKNIFFSSYPLNFKENDLFFEIKFRDLVSKNDTFLLTLFSDGFHQNLNIFEYFKYKNKLKKINSYKIIIFENFLSLKDIFLTIIKSIKIFYSILKLKQKTYQLNGIDLSGYLSEELNVSYSRISRNILIIKTLNNFLKCISFDSFNYYLHELPIGRAISYVLKKNNISNSFAFQHGPSSNRKLIYFLSKNETYIDQTNNFNCVPLPKNLYAEDNYSKKIYYLSNYKNIKLMNKIPRLYYLKNILINKKTKDILVVPGLHDGNFLLNEINNRFINSKSDNIFIFKPHPKSNLKKIDLINSKRLIISNDHISNLLSRVSKVICTYSSVAVEAKILGLEVELIDLPGKINLSPLLDPEFIKILPELKDKLLR